MWPTIGATYGSYEALKKIIARFRKATDVLVGRGRELEERGFAPADPLRLATVKRWKVGELSDALGLTREETVDLLEGFGFSRDVAGTWRPPPDSPPELSRLLLAALTSYEAISRDYDALSERLRSELDAYAKRQDP
jgi:hypothetical protein